MRDGTKSYEKRVVVYLHLLDICSSCCADKNSRPVDATDKCPKSRMSIRIKQPKTLESKRFRTFAEMGGGTFVKHFELDLPGLILQKF